MIRLATVFSGIGAVEQALKKLNLEHEIVFACDNGERELKLSRQEIEKQLEEINIDKREEFITKLYQDTNKPNYMQLSYLANYNVLNDDFYQDIRFINGNKYKNNIDLLVGGSPCQSFSIIGKRGGFEDTRGTLFFEYARLINECQPKVFIYENVKGMLTHDKGKTWQVIKNTFDDLNYDVYLNDDPILNAKDYGIPQNRPRLFVVGIRKDIKLEKKFTFPKKQELTNIVSSFYEKEVEPKYYLGQKGFEFVTNPKYKNRAQVNKDIMMCQKANQQFNWNGDFVFEKFDPIKHNIDIKNRGYLSTYNGEEGYIRKLTPRECLRLMGFSDDFKIVVPDVQIYRQSGNSIVVNVLEQIILKIIETEVWR